jgi:uncharacterized protein (TIGR03435 family)
VRLEAIAVALAAGVIPSASPQSEAIPKFEVVSIRPCAGKPPNPLDGRGGGAGKTTFSPGRMHLECMTLGGDHGLIRDAYGKFANGRVNAYWVPLPVEGGPPWVRSDPYTIEAKAEGTPAAAMMRGPMLQALLEDRFQLSVHRETRSIPVYDLTVAKGGPKLKPFAGGCTPIDFTKDLPAQLEAAGSCDIATRGTSVDAPGQTIDEFIKFVLIFLDRPVVDKTGLTGRYDIHLDLPADENSAAHDVTSTLAMAVQQQLGLKLSPARGPGEFLVIDRVERPR